MFVLDLPRTNRKERLYVCRYVLRERLGIDFALGQTESDRTVLHGPSGRRIEIPDVYFSTGDGDYLKGNHRPSSTPAVLASELTKGHTTIGAFPGGSGDQAVKLAQTTAALTFDVLGAIFFMLSRVEEVASGPRDRHQRFPSAAAWSVRAGLGHRPLVDEWIYLLRAAVERYWQGATTERASYSVAPSHDIDHAFMYHGRPPGAKIGRLLRRMAGDIWHRHSIVDALRTASAFSTYLRGGAVADPYLTLRALAAESESRGLKSTFYLILQPETEIDGRPYLHDESLRALCKEIAARGHRVALHANYQTLCDYSRASSQLERLRELSCDLRIEPQLAVRQHYLRWSALDHPAMWDDAGASDDASLGFPERIGFRCGTSHSFPLFDLKARRELKLREQPLIVMDGAICPDGVPQTKALRDQAIRSVAEIVEQCRRHKGRFEILWHNTHFQTDFQRALYRQILDLSAAGVEH